ncbi:MAG: PorP/SprF family type IX secretion system membrane protein [Crocinitomicaceae bacterium]|nr:PorP/SprF family type IX secretion system membrane protein [Crocinitomicaceae bacterium]
MKPNFMFRSFKKTFAFVGLLAIAGNSIAQQDKHFSMFAESPVYLNPATAGFAPGKMQLFTNYRMQWLTISDNPYNTISASADGRLFDNGNNFLGVGVNFYNDVAGDAQFKTNEITVPINYALSVGKTHRIALGLQPSWYSRTIASSSLTWDNQWNGVAFDQAIPSYETVYSQNINLSKFDVAAGFHWYGTFKKNWKISLGLAGHHLTKPRINFYTDDDRLFRKLVLHGQFTYRQENSNLSVIPAFYGFIQGPNKELTLGSNFRYVLRGASRVTGYFNEMAINFGVYYRVGDAAIANIMFDISGMTIGAAYDANISSLSPASNGVGGFEVFLRWRLQFGNKGLGNPSIQ